MYVERVKSKQGNKTYQQTLLRESYRVPGAPRSAVKKRTILNLTKYPEQDVAAIELALKHKRDLPKLKQLLEGKLIEKQGPCVGAVWVLWQIALSIGLDKALGKSREALLCLWLVLARVIDQGSRLSAVRLAREHAVCELLGLSDFNEDSLYQAMDWLEQAQPKIEKKLFTQTYGDQPPTLFLYDVTSSYLEGDQNELGDWGYNRDKKRGKKQIVVGLLCDGDGTPVSARVFTGNTPDIQTLAAQIQTAAREFNCQRVTFVGDRGMIKSGQIEDLNKAGFNYITAITKPQIRAMIKQNVLQLGLFDEELCEVEHNGLRYVLRRNPVRAEEVAGTRASKIAKLKALAEKESEYLAAHPKADRHKAWKRVIEKSERYGIGTLVLITAQDRQVDVTVDEERLAEISDLDGCYALKTDLPAELADKDLIHDRYKDLAEVEIAFRTMKTDHLEMRPIYVRDAERTKAHIFIVMLAYRLRLLLREAWRDFDLTVEEGLKMLSTLCAVEHEIADQKCGYLTVPEPKDSLASLFAALNINPPEVLPRRTAVVDTRKKLPSRRKSK